MAMQQVGSFAGSTIGNVTTHSQVSKREILKDERGSAEARLSQKIAG